MMLNHAEKNKKLVIVGAGEFAELAFEYFQCDSPYEVCGFAVEKQYHNEKQKYGLPIVEFEKISDNFPPQFYEAFVAVTFSSMNSERQRLHVICTKQGYQMASYISSYSFASLGASLSAGSFVMEHCSVQKGVSVGAGAVVWCGCNLAHGTKIGDFAWIAPGVSIGGRSWIEESCFIGVGASVGDEVHIPKACLIGAGAVVTKSPLQAEAAYAGNKLSKLDDRVYSRFASSARDSS